MIFMWSHPWSKQWVSGAIASGATPTSWRTSTTAARVDAMSAAKSMSAWFGTRTSHRAMSTDDAVASRHRWSCHDSGVEAGRRGSGGDRGWRSGQSRPLRAPVAVSSSTGTPRHPFSAPPHSGSRRSALCSSAFSPARRYRQEDRGRGRAPRRWGAVVVVMALLPSTPVPGSGPAPPHVAREARDIDTRPMSMWAQAGDVMGEAGRSAPGSPMRGSMTMGSYVLAFAAALTAPRSPVRTWRGVRGSTGWGRRSPTFGNRGHQPHPVCPAGRRPGRERADRVHRPRHRRPGRRRPASGCPGLAHDVKVGERFRSAWGSASAISSASA
jgi:hypothetical protein